jgi:hypothetical protein
MADEKEEARVEVVKDEVDRKQFDAFALKDKDPNKYYRFARKRDMNIARHEFNGYEVVDTTTDKVRSILDASTRMKKGTDVGTHIEIADMILMSTTKENHERLMKEREEKIKRQTRSVTQSFKRTVEQTAGRYGARAYEEHSDNPNMEGRGMSEKALSRLRQEEAHERQRELDKLGLKG